MTSPSTPRISSDLWITEGGHKAAVCSSLFGLHVLGMSGAWLTKNHLPAIHRHNPERIILALDADKRTNPQVMAAERSGLKFLLASGDWQVAVAEWDIELGKGIDDLLKNGHHPMIVPVRPGPGDEPGEERPVDGPEASSAGKESAARAASRTMNLYHARANNGELSPLSYRGGQLADSTARPERINVIAPEDGVSKEDLLPLIRMVEGPESKLIERVKQCGWDATKKCKDHPDEHGEQGKTRKTCKLGAHAACLTETAAKIRQSSLTDLEGESRYRSDWLKFCILFGDQSEWEAQMRTVNVRVAQWGTKASKKAKFKGKLLHRSTAFGLMQEGSEVTLRLLMREDTPGDCDALVEDAIATFGVNRDLPGTVAEKYTQLGETAIVQAMEDSSSTLLWLIGDYQDELFDAWWGACKRQKLSQGYAGLYQAVKERAKETLPVCAVCGGDLILVPIPPEPKIPTLDEWDDRGYEQATSPPAYRERQEVLAW